MRYRPLLCQLKRSWINSFDPLDTSTPSFSLFVFVAQSERYECQAEVLDELFFQVFITGIASESVRRKDFEKRKPD